MTGLLEVLWLEQVVVHAWSGDVSERFKLDLSEVAENLHALTEKTEHVVPDCSDGLHGSNGGEVNRAFKERQSKLETFLGFCRADFYWKLPAP